MAKLTKAQRRVLKRAHQQGYYSGGPVGYSIFIKLQKRGYIARMRRPIGKLSNGDTLYGHRIGATDKGRKALGI